MLIYTSTWPICVKAGSSDVQFEMQSRSCVKVVAVLVLTNMPEHDNSLVDPRLRLSISIKARNYLSYAVSLTVNGHQSHTMLTTTYRAN